MALLVLGALLAPDTPAEPSPQTAILIARRHWHMDIGFAVAALDAPATIGAVLPGPGVILISGLRAAPERAFGADQVIELWVTPVQAQAIQTYISNSLATRDAYAPGPYEGSLYFSAAVRYSALHTCNTWVAAAMRAGGLPIRAHGIILAGQLWKRVRKIAAVNRSEAGYHSGTPPPSRSAAAPPP